MLIRFIYVFAGLCGAVAVALGALHAHGMDQLLAQQGYEPAVVQDRMRLCDTANRYLLMHAVAILACAALLSVHPRLTLKLGALGLILGTIGFCGPIYMLTFSSNDIWSNVAPVGGMTIIISWLLIATTAFVPQRVIDPVRDMGL